MFVRCSWCDKKLLCAVVVVVVWVVALWAYQYRTHPIPPTTPPQSEFPKIIYQTIRDKRKVPPKVYNNVRIYAPGHQHVIFDDKECVSFLETFYGGMYAKRFHSLQRGPHKADFFRYCLLYKMGGIYMDIKTELITPVPDIFPDRTKLYSVVQYDKRGIYQGILASPAGNKIFLELIEYVLYNNPRHYLDYTEDFYNRISQYPQDKIVLFEEQCTNDGHECGGLDRYGLCCHVYSQGKKIIKTRFNDYPW
jgi:hypothetical protein